MWALDNNTPFAAGRNWLRDKEGVHHWLVAIKATFDIAPNGKLTLADEQPPPLLAPEHRGEPGKSSLRADSDLLEAKPSTDVLVDGSAHAPGGRPATGVPVGLRVEGLDKRLVVYGTRVYYKGLRGWTTSSPRPFTKQPIHYEWAFGGVDLAQPDPKKHRIDARNPVGRGFIAHGTHVENSVAHAVEYPSGNAATVGPAGFGPIDRSWSPRCKLAGTYDARWEASKKPLLPDDYDPRFGLSAPVDQRFPKPLQGGETIYVLNMTPEGALRFELPKVFLALRTRFGGRSEEHRTTLATVFIATEEKKLSMVWQSTLRVRPREVDYLDETRIDEKTYIR